MWPCVLCLRWWQTEPGQRLLAEGQHEAGGQLVQRAFLRPRSGPHRLHSEPLRCGVAQTSSKSQGRRPPGCLRFGPQLLLLPCRVWFLREPLNHVEPDSSCWLIPLQAVWTTWTITHSLFDKIMSSQSRDCGLNHFISLTADVHEASNSKERQQIIFMIHLKANSSCARYHSSAHPFLCVVW